MDLKHFGDSYDIVKKSLLQWLAAFGPWAAHPMFTHETDASQAGALSEFLGIPLISTEVLRKTSDRQDYFNCCKGYRSLFLDPDTGVKLRTITDKRSSRYVFAPELIDIAEARGPDSLMLVFDQSLVRGREREEIRSKLAHFRWQGVHGFAYVSHASFVILSNSTATIQKARKAVVAESGLPENRIVVAEDD
jgi:hypothetical protein